MKTLESSDTQRGAIQPIVVCTLKKLFVV